jgi:virginiamycin B lyase
MDGTIRIEKMTRRERLGQAISFRLLTRSLFVSALMLSACASQPPQSTPTAPVQPAVPTLSAAAPMQAASATPSLTFSTAPRVQVQEYPVPRGSHPHDVAPAPDGSIWYTAQASGELGRLDPVTGQTHHIKLGEGSAPHGVIIGPDGAPWITDGGLNAILRVNPATEQVQRFPLPAGRGNANLNTATFDPRGILWFTGQSGIYGRLDPATGKVEVFDAPRGPGPYGITTTPDGAIYFASLAGSYIARVDVQTGAATALEPPTPRQGARRVWWTHTGASG